MTTGSTRQQAVDAIAEAIPRARAVQAGWAFGVPDDGRNEWATLVAEAAYDAVEPLIRADQRERDAQLADDCGATYVHQGEYTGGPKSVRPFGDLLRAQAPS